MGKRADNESRVAAILRELKELGEAKKVTDDAILKASEEYEKNAKRWGIEDFLAQFDELNGENPDDDQEVIDRAIALLTKDKKCPRTLATLKQFAADGYEL